MDEHKEPIHRGPVNDEQKNMYRQVEKLALQIGELVTAIKGNDMGTLGVIGQLRQLDGRMDSLDLRIDTIDERIDKVERAADQARVELARRQLYLNVIWGLLGVVGGTIFMTIINHLSPIIKH